MRAAWALAAAMVGVFALPLAVAAVDRNESDPPECGRSGCLFTGMDEARDVVRGVHGDDGLEEHGWRELIIDRIGDPVDLVDCGLEAVTVSVLAWTNGPDDMILDTYVAGWQDERVRCAARRSVVVGDIPFAAMSGSAAPGETVIVNLPQAGDTFLVEPSE